LKALKLFLCVANQKKKTRPVITDSQNRWSLTYFCWSFTSRNGLFYENLNWQLTDSFQKCHPKPRTLHW